MKICKVLYLFGSYCMGHFIYSCAIRTYYALHSAEMPKILIIILCLFVQKVKKITVFNMVVMPDGSLVSKTAVKSLKSMCFRQYM